MLLRLRAQPDRAVVYWEKWTTALTGLAAGGVCVGFAAALYWLSADVAGAARPFVLVFCLVFGAVGIVALASLPRRIRRLASEDGAAHVEIDGRGIAITPMLGAERAVLAWEQIAGVHLADRFTSIEQGEKGYAWRVLFVMLTQEEREPLGPGGRSRTGLLRSGAGRSYVAAGFPRGAAGAVLVALRRHAPPGTPVARHRQVEFDRKSGQDRFDGRTVGSPRAR